MGTIIWATIQITVVLLPWAVASVRGTRFGWAILPSCIMAAFVWEMNIALGFLFYIALLYFSATMPSRWKRKRKRFPQYPFSRIFNR